MRVTCVRTVCWAAWAAAALLCSVGLAEDKGPGETVNLRLSLRDADSGELVPGRITVEQRPEGAKSVYHFVESLDPAGSAVRYDVARSETSFEKHTTVSAHPFGATVPPGRSASTPRSRVTPRTPRRATRPSHAAVCA